jgi:hypothetical protein
MIFVMFRNLVAGTTVSAYGFRIHVKEGSGFAL